MAKTFEQKQFDFNKYGAFFAFSQEQFNEQKKDGVKYIASDTGLFYPVKFKNIIWKKVSKFYKKEQKRELKERGREGTILYHLLNHEAFYVGDITDSVETLKGYGVSEDEVLKVYEENCSKYCE